MNGVDVLRDRARDLRADAMSIDREGGGRRNVHGAGLFARMFWVSSAPG